MTEQTTGFYYLHENGSLIYKNTELDDEVLASPFVKCVWHITQISRTPQEFAKFLREALAKGAEKERVMYLADHNRLAGFIPNWREEPQDD